MDRRARSPHHRAGGERALGAALAGGQARAAQKTLLPRRDRSADAACDAPARQHLPRRRSQSRARVGDAVMTALHERLNAATREQAASALLRCCGSARWVERVLARRPFASLAELQAVAKEAWSGLDRADYLEAFAQHP